MKLPAQIDTTAWAKWQDSVFASSIVPTWDEAGFWADLHAAQSFLCETNLTLRQNIIYFAITKNEAYASFVLVAVNTLHRNGFWLEGFSYWKYVCAGFLWLVRLTGRDLMDQAVAAMIDSNYALIVSPTLEIWLPEVAAGVAIDVSVDSMGDYVSLDSFYVRRWFNSDRSQVTSYLLIAKDCSPSPKLNLHYHLAAGYVAFYSDGKVQTKCDPYTGFNPGKIWDDGGLDKLLPAGALQPTWRILAPSVVWDKVGSGFFFHWAYPYMNCSRKIDVQERTLSQPGKLVITDTNWNTTKKVYEYLIT